MCVCVWKGLDTCTVHVGLGALFQLTETKKKGVFVEAKTDLDN